MSVPDTDLCTRAQRLQELVAEYEIRLDNGQAVGRDEFIREHPGFEQELRRHFQGIDAIHACAKTLPQVTLTRVPADGDSFGDYEVLETIGRGGMGVVYKACQKSLDRIVALKMIRAHLEENRDDVQRFFGEAEAAARLQHPHIVRIYQVGEERGHPFFSMDFVEGKSLAAAISENPLPQRRAAEYLRKIADAMQFAHDHNVVHRDLKPANVLIDQDDEPRITDFGLAKRIDCDSKLTATGAPMGTPSYMSPEQARGVWHEVGVHSDIYSLGATLYDLLVGRPPFSAATWPELLVQVLNHEPVAPRVLNPSIDRDLETICLKCLQKKPADRYASAQELADDLRRYLAGEPIRARPISRVERTWRWCRRYPLAVAAMTSLAVGLCLAIAFYWQANSARIEAEANFRDACGAVDDLLTAVSNDTLLNEPGLQPLRRKLLERARDYYERLRQRTSADPSTRLEHARITYQMAKIDQELGQTASARALYAQAYAVLTVLSRESPSDPSVLDSYSTALMLQGTIGHAVNDLDDAAARYAQAGQLRQQLKRSLETPAGRSWLAQQLPSVQERLRFVDRLIANTVKNRGDVELDRWRSQANSTPTLEAWRKVVECLDAEREVLAALARTAADDPDVRHDLAQVEYTLGRCFLVLLQSGASLEQEPRSGVLRDGNQHFGHAVQQFEWLLRQGNSSSERRSRFDYLDAQYDHATALRAWGDFLLSAERLSEAEEKYRTAVKAFQDLSEANPAVTSYQLQTASAYLNLAICLSVRGDDEEGMRWADDAERILTRLDREYPALREDCRALRAKLQGLREDTRTEGRDPSTDKQIGGGTCRFPTAVAVGPPAASVFVAKTAATG